MRSLFSIVTAIIMLFHAGLMGQTQVNPVVKEEMIALNKQMKTDRLVVSMQNECVINETYRGNPDALFPLYSITKVFSSLAIGILIDQKKIPHCEVPVATYYPVWAKDSLKSKITIRHVLQHTSGIEAANGSQLIYPESDFVAYALNQPVRVPAGTVFFYNNTAYNLLSGIVQKVSGLPLSDFIQKNVFQPLEISNYSWNKDATGQTWGMDGLAMNATDLLKIGQLLSQKGLWKGNRIISEQWCTMMFQIPLTNAMAQKYGYAMGIRCLPFQEVIQIPKTTLEQLEHINPNDKALKVLWKMADTSWTYLTLGNALSESLSVTEIERITTLAYQFHLPLYEIQNQNFYLQHGGEFGHLLAIYPKQDKVLVRLLGEKWGRKKNDSQTEYRYSIDTPLINYLLKL
ncbi:serine hydrolase domain-containing protein [Flavobacterium fontis]|nr:serine hydrolase domain-containing protein [Flavobacterium fontis]